MNHKIECTVNDNEVCIRLNKESLDELIAIMRQLKPNKHYHLEDYDILADASMKLVISVR